jgi:hypothetical protein
VDKIEFLKEIKTLSLPRYHHHQNKKHFLLFWICVRFSFRLNRTRNFRDPQAFQASFFHPPNIPSLDLERKTFIHSTESAPGKENRKKGTKRFPFVSRLKVNLFNPTGKWIFLDF